MQYTISFVLGEYKLIINSILEMGEKRKEFWKVVVAITIAEVIGIVLWESFIC
ncbi:MAG: hypothetical protein IKP62_01635 [Salinivirgaceae bacterium]|nr:hypothetical protein [Salinivirgaceae bacterium]